MTIWAWLAKVLLRQVYSEFPVTEHAHTLVEVYRRALDPMRWCNLSDTSALYTDEIHNTWQVGLLYRVVM